MLKGLRKLGKIDDLERKRAYVKYNLWKHYRRFVNQKYIKKDYSEKKRILNKEEGIVKSKLIERIENWWERYYAGLWTREEILDNVKYRFDEFYWLKYFNLKIEKIKFNIKVENNSFKDCLDLWDLSKLYMYMLENSKYLLFYWREQCYKFIKLKDWQRTIERKLILNRVENAFRDLERKYLGLNKDGEENTKFYINWIEEEESIILKDWIKKEEYMYKDEEHYIDIKRLKSKIRHFYKLDELVTKIENKKNERLLRKLGEGKTLLERTYNCGLMENFMKKWLETFEKKKKEHEKNLKEDQALIRELLDIKEEKGETYDKFLKFVELRQQFLIKFEQFCFINYVNTKWKSKKKNLNLTFKEGVFKRIKEMVILNTNLEKEWFLSSKFEGEDVLKPKYKQVWREAFKKEKKDNEIWL